MKTPTLLLSTLTVAVVLFAPSAHADSTPMETVQHTITTVMNILNDQAFEESGMAEARRAALETAIRNAVSYREMARRALGITWLMLGDAERARFGELFVQVLRDAVAARMNMYTVTNVLYLSEQRDGKFAEVRTVFRGVKNDTSVDVRLVNQSGRWLMYDAVIDGVRLVDNYRSQFIHVMKEGAYIGLVGRLEAMVLVPKTFERTVAR